MKDSLKDFINTNRGAFDDKVPAEDGWSAIENALPQAKQRTLWNSLALWRSAAIILLSLSVYLFISRDTSLGTPRKEQAMLKADLSDLESFYGSQIAEKTGLINDFTLDGDDQFAQDFQKLDAMYQVLKEEMKNHPGKKVKDAIILNLLVRIDLLNQQLKKLEERRKNEKPIVTS